MIEKYIVQWTSHEGDIDIREYTSEHHAWARAHSAPEGWTSQVTEVYAFREESDSYRSEND